MKTVRKISAGAKAPPKRKRVAAYARVSMESDRLAHSLSAQISYYSGLIQKNPEWEFAGVYADRFVSGTSAERRAEFQRMLADCEAGRIDIILNQVHQQVCPQHGGSPQNSARLKELSIEAQQRNAADKKIQSMRERRGAVEQFIRNLRGRNTRVTEFSENLCCALQDCATAYADGRLFPVHERF